MRDYCSYSPDWLFGVYIGDACKQHDYEYENHNVSRLKSDWSLFMNIGKKRFWLWPFALIYFLAVRVFGALWAW